jgi:hypothetical protein
MLSQAFGQLQKGIVFAGKQGAVAIAVGGSGSGDDQYNGWVFNGIRVKKGSVESACVDGNGGRIGSMAQILRVQLEPD